MGPPRLPRILVLAWAVSALVLSGAASAEQPSPASRSARVPELTPPPRLQALVGRVIRRVEFSSVGTRWKEAGYGTHVRPGQVFTTELARRAASELVDSGRFADVRAEVRPEGDGVVLRFVVVPRRVVASLRISGGVFDDEVIQRALGTRAGAELTATELPRLADRVRAEYARRGYPQAGVVVDAIDTDDPMQVVLSVEIQEGPSLNVGKLSFLAWPDPKNRELAVLLQEYGPGVGSRADDELLSAADRDLESLLRAKGWHRATVRHVLRPMGPRKVELRVEIEAWAKVVYAFEGNRLFDADELRGALELEDGDDRSAPVLVERLHQFYVERGMYDAEIVVEERGSVRSPTQTLVFKIREGQPLRVVAREYPCLDRKRSVKEVNDEIDSFLAELPGTELLSAVDPHTVDDLYGSGRGPGRRAPLRDLTPWSHYVPEVYERAVEHLQDLFRSEGYLSAVVGPVQLIRRACHPRSPAGKCIPVGPAAPPRVECRYDEVGLPLEEPPFDVGASCTPDPKKGRHCESRVRVSLPIKLGPRAYLYDVGFEGNDALVEAQLHEALELELGVPVSQVEIEKARRRLLDLYAEEGFAFAEVEAALDLSTDHTRARARFVISERDRVRVSRIVVRGANLTSERLIRSRVALEEGQLYRRSLARTTEERLATLGVFASVNVGLEDPYVPAREKVVLISVEERKPQYLDVRPGFSTGEGFRITFEYGHRNLVGEAIQLTLRSQLGYLPEELILEPDVRQKYDDLELVERLERRNSAGLEFPEVGLGPLFRLSVEGVDIRDNARDFGITKDAGIVTLAFRPDRRLSVQAGGSLELNDAAIFGTEQKCALVDYVTANPGQRNTFRVPEGTTLAKAERIGLTWDRRDSPLDATEGHFVSLGVEHVRADPVSQAENAACGGNSLRSVFAATSSQFLRYTGRIAGYVRLSRRGLALAVSLRGGLIQQLFSGSQTYPDRLFFMGGVDTIRGFAQDGLIPEDIAKNLLDPNSELTEREVVIRGGDVFINPRAELRIPLTNNVQTALFVDSGNLWTSPFVRNLDGSFSRNADGTKQVINPFRLRYSTGTGLRIATPIGPLVFDYGFNVERVLDRLYPSRKNQRTWEDLGAFHFSIGLF